MSTPVERIIPSELDGEELFRRNSEYVEARHYDSLQAQVEVMRAALKKIRDMEPSAIGDSGFVHGPALLLANCKREARAALSPIKPSDADRREADPHA